MAFICKNGVERCGGEQDESFTVRKMFKYLFSNKNLLVYYAGVFFYSGANIATHLNLFVSFVTLSPNGIFHRWSNPDVGNTEINISVNADSYSINTEFRNGSAFGESLVCGGEAECSAEFFSVYDFSSQGIGAVHHGVSAFGIADGKCFADFR